MVNGLEAAGMTTGGVIGGITGACIGFEVCGFMAFCAEVSIISLNTFLRSTVFNALHPMANVAVLPATLNMVSTAMGTVSADSWGPTMFVLKASVIGGMVLSACVGAGLGAYLGSRVANLGKSKFF